MPEITIKNTQPSLLVKMVTVQLCWYSQKSVIQLSDCFMVVPQGLPGKIRVP